MSRPTLRNMLLRVEPVRSVLTVRHPLDSFLSLVNNGWEDFIPFTLETYAERYALFLTAYEGQPLYRYEDFLEEPDAVLAQICVVFDLPFQKGVQELLKVVKMTGDSGRGSTRIAPRPRPAPQRCWCGCLRAVFAALICIITTTVVLARCVLKSR